MENVNRLLDDLKRALEQAQRNAEEALKEHQETSEKYSKADALVANLQRSIEALSDLTEGNVKWRDYQ